MSNVDTDGFTKLKLWEKGEYYDIVLRSLFLQNKYEAIYIFLFKSVGLNETINIESGEDFYNLIKLYYNLYIDQSGEHFEQFFVRHFANKIKEV